MVWSKIMDASGSSTEPFPHTISWGTSVMPFFSHWRRNSAYESITVGMPLAGSKRATWAKYLRAGHCSVVMRCEWQAML